MAIKTIRINSDNFTEVSVEPYQVHYKKIRGNHSRYAQDGSYKDDVRAVKAIVTWQPMPMLESNALLKKLVGHMQETYVTLYYYDPASGYRTITATPSEPDFQFKGEGPSGNVWTVSAISFTEI